MRISLNTIILLVSASLMISIVSFYPPPVSHHYPSPTEVIRKGSKARKQYKQRRKQWQEERHATAEGTDWKAMDANSRSLKKRLRDRRRESLSSPFRSGGVEYLADSSLVGYWGEKGSYNQAGRVHTIEVDFDQNTIFLGSAGHNLWRGTLGGQNWTSLNDQSPAYTTFLRKHNGRLMMAGGKKFQYSEDDGETWAEASGLSSFSDWGDIERVIMTNTQNPVIYMLVMEWDYTQWYSIATIYRSTDLGTSFSKIQTLGQYDNDKDIWTARQGTSGKAYLMNALELFEIDENSGDLISLGSINTNVNSTLLTGSEAGGQTIFYAKVGDRVYRSTNGGGFWQLRSSTPTGTFTNRSFQASAKNADFLYIGEVDCYASYNGGQTWTLINNWYEYYDYPATKLHADLPSIQSILDPTGEEILFVSTDGGLFYSNDYLQNVQNLSLQGLGVSQYYSTLTHDNGIIYAGSQDQGFQRSSADNGYILNFEQTISGDYGSISSGDGGASLWTVYPGFVMYYADAANNEDAIFWDFVGDGWQWMSPLMVDPADPAICYAGGGDDNPGQYLWKLESWGGGLSSERLDYDFSLSNTNQITAIAVNPADGAFRYVLTNKGRFFYSSDSGENWSLSAINENSMRGNAIAPSLLNPGTVYICGSGYDNPGVWFSDNHGETFMALAEDLPATSINDICLSDEEEFLYAATDIGPYVYVFEKGKWYDMMGLGAPDQTYMSVEYVASAKIVRFGTYGRGIWDFNIDAEPISTKEPSALQFKVWPNPVTQGFVNIQVPQAIHKNVVIRLTSLDGKLIKEVQYDELLEESIRFETGELAAGNYLLSIITQGQVSSQKLIIP